MQAQRKKHKVKKLSSEGTVELIHLYKERESLWNLHSEKYRRAELKRRDMGEIARIMGMSESDIKLKLRALRSTYLMENKKVEDSKKTASSPEEIYVPTLAWFNEMTFLNDCIIRRHSFPPLLKRSRTHKLFCKAKAIQHIEINDETQTNSTTEEEPINNSRLDNAIQTLLDLNNQKYDAMESFGRSVAAQLSELPPEKAYPAMAEIQNLLVAKKLSCLRNNPHC